MNGCGAGRLQSVGVGVPAFSPYTSVRAALGLALAVSHTMMSESGWKMLMGVEVNASLLIRLDGISAQNSSSILTVSSTSHRSMRMGSNSSGKHCTHKTPGGLVVGRGGKAAHGRRDSSREVSVACVCARALRQLPEEVGCAAWGNHSAW